MFLPDWSKENLKVPSAAFMEAVRALHTDYDEHAPSMQFCIRAVFQETNRLAREAQ